MLQYNKVDPAVHMTTSRHNEIILTRCSHTYVALGLKICPFYVRSRIVCRCRQMYCASHIIRVEHYGKRKWDMLYFVTLWSYTKLSWWKELRFCQCKCQNKVLGIKRLLERIMIENTLTACSDNENISATVNIRSIIVHGSVFPLCEP